MKIYKPKTIKEAIDNLQTFLESDLYTKFRPEVIIPTSNKKKVKMYRQDPFVDEKEFWNYLQGHFDILRKQIKNLQKGKFSLRNNVPEPKHLNSSIY